MQNLVVFYHQGTVEGKTSAYILKSILPDSEYIPVDFINTRSLNTTDVEGKDVYILGYPIKTATWDIFKECKSVTYVSSQVDYFPESLGEVKLQNISIQGKSTFVSLWQHLFPSKPMPEIYKCIDTYLYPKVDSPSNQGLLGYFISTILSFKCTLESFITKFLEIDNLLKDSFLSPIYAEGKAYDTTIQSLALYILQNSETNIINLFGVDTLIVNISKIFNGFIKEDLMKEHKNLLMYHDVGERRYWSFQSKEIEASTIARLFGGFGNSFSSGFETPVDYTTKTLNEIWKDNQEKECEY